MSRLFDGVNDVITGTIAPVDTGDWTMGAFIYLNSYGEIGSLGNPEGMLFGIDTGSGGTDRQRVKFAQSINGRLDAYQEFSTSRAFSRTSTNLTLNEWLCVVATFRAADAFTRIYWKELLATDVMAESGYGTHNAGVGTRLTGGTRMGIGAAPSGGLTHFDGRIARPFLVARELTLAEMEAYRLGHEPIQGAFE